MANGQCQHHNEIPILVYMNGYVYDALHLGGENQSQSASVILTVEIYSQLDKNY